MALEHREQGETRQQILHLLRHHSTMTAAELSDALGIGAVGVRQHLALLERDGLVKVTGVRRGIGRPSHLYILTPSAEAMFPKDYDRLALEALAFVAAQGGTAAVERLFAGRRERMAHEYALRLAGKDRDAAVAELARILTEHGYMCEVQHQVDGSLVFTQYNCPIDCVARAHPQACSQELALYEELLASPLQRDETIAEGGSCCRYRLV